ncbi:MAG: hypothetical protein HY329_00040 [Chloroflexi bacterium]|nr:hypothetical protein [Chloroflexota bacterium]
MLEVRSAGDLDPEFYELTFGDPKEPFVVFVPAWLGVQLGQLVRSTIPADVEAVGVLDDVLAKVASSLRHGDVRYSTPSIVGFLERWLARRG